MNVTRGEIRKWLDKAQDCKATHMLVVSDDFSHEYYPVTVGPGEDLQERITESGGKVPYGSGNNMQRVVEVYDLAQDLEPQLAAKRTWSC